MESLRVTVVVAGDVGRSPRMQYHALALAANHVDVDLVGFGETSLPRALRDHPRISLHLLRDRAGERSRPDARGRFLLFAAWRAFRQALSFARVLLAKSGKPDVVLVQTPPAIPLLAIALVVARLRGARLVVDWHNFGWSLLALRLGAGHPAVRLVRAFEGIVGRLADAHLCVSRAMQEELARVFGIAAVVLRDRPADAFSPTPPEARAALFRRLRDVGGASGLAYDPDDPARPALVVSATSWSADEDFSLLLDAVVRWETLAAERATGDPARRLPRLSIIVTGRGPLRAEVERRIAALSLAAVEIRTWWLEPEDYPLLLGAADLGVSFHRSASGVDLPMKVADMFGSGLAVCALDYGACLGELLRHGENGLVFSSGDELARQWADLFAGFPSPTPLLEELRRNVARSTDGTWGEGWLAEARPVLAR